MSDRRTELLNGNLTEAMPGLGSWLMQLSDVGEALDGTSLLEWASCAPAGLAAGPGLSRGPERSYRRIFSSRALDGWLIRWSDTRETSFHDHEESSGAVRVLAGELVEETPALGGPRRRVHGAGKAFCFGPDHVHRVRPAAGREAISLHLYSPPLGRLG